MNPDGTNDSNAVSLYETSSGQDFTYSVIDGSAGTAALKITSHATAIEVVAQMLVGGSENCVDLNNECEKIVVSCDRYEIRGKYGLSAKTCKDVVFKGHLAGTPSKWHVNLGSWSDQSKNPQENTKLELTATNYPITVWLGNVRGVTFDDPKKYKVVFKVPFGEVGRKLFMFGWSVLKALHLA